VKAPSRLTVITAALVILLPALAVLQYHWVGQLSDAARERMRRNLHNAAQQFRESFDGQVARAFVGLQADSTVVRDQAWDRYAERYATWSNTAPYPGLVSNVFIVDAQGSQLRLRKWDAEGRTFSPTAWDGPLASARDHFASELTSFTAGTAPRRERVPFAGHEHLLIAPLLNIQIGLPPQGHFHAPIVRTFGFTVLQLNLPLIQQQILPALAQRHFSHTADDAYRVAVVDAVNAGTVIYKSSPDAGTDAAKADVNMLIFGAHHDPLMFLARGAARETGEIRNMVVSVVRDRRDLTERNGELQLRLNSQGGRWRLLAQHESGSLEVAVSGMRNRNLIISFSILMLMGVSIALLSLSSRRAQRLARQQMEFVAGVSHELRTPVAVIRSAAENLSHGVVGDAERVRRYGDTIQAESRRLGEMIERVLQFAGIESGRRLACEPLAVEPLVREAIEAALPPGTTFTVERHVPVGLPPVLGEPSALRSAIQNLLTNAMKYGGADRWIGVGAHASPDGREVRVTVQDHGGGITPSDLPHIFDPFYRGANATSRQIQGNGLGLSLVRSIAEAHGGRVTMTTRDGEGSAFTLHLPAAVVTADAVVLRSPDEAAAR
jgi:signal transduction histidine kinase